MKKLYRFLKVCSGFIVTQVAIDITYVGKTLLKNWFPIHTIGILGLVLVGSYLFTQNDVLGYVAIVFLVSTSLTNNHMVNAISYLLNFIYASVIQLLEFTTNTKGNIRNLWDTF